MTRLRRGPFVYLTLTLLWLQLIPTAVAHQQVAQWSARIDAIINGPNYRQSHWGVLVTDAKTGEVVYPHNADRMLLPASVTKLFSVAAALCLLGVDFLFETPVYARGKLKDGKLKGDLILVASGDVTMGGRTDAKGQLAFRDHDHTYAGNGTTIDCLTDTDPLAGLKALAKQVAASGVKHIEGDVLIDERLFERSKSSGSGPTTVTPIVINDNVIDVIVTPADKAGDPAQVRMRPETDFVRMDAQVQTVAGAVTKLEVKALGGERFAVRGQIGVKAKAQVRTYHVEDPAGFARALFLDALRQHGVTVNASGLQAPRAELPERESYARLERVALHKSPPFAEVAKVTLKVSHNLYASTLPLLVAAKHGKRTLGDGLKLQRDLLADLGVDTKTISFGGGAGGAGADYVTPRATVQLLQGMAKRPEYKAYEAALPVLGVDGTLADVVGPNSPARGAVKAKTGTYSWYDVLNNRSLLTSKALAGVLTTMRGRRLLFTMFVNQVPLPPGVGPAREGRVLGQLCEIIHQHAP